MPDENEYFDKTLNDQHKKQYYHDITQDDQFSINLSALLNKSHFNHLPYEPSIYLYPEVDRQASGKLFSIYSGKEFELEQLLRMDAQIRLERFAFKRSLIAERLANNRFESVEEDDLEGRPYNCEHIVPQAWFKKFSPMKGDLHHLFTCEEKCNQFRANYKYFDFKDYPELVKDECGKHQNYLFEPERNKGIVARATLYFLLRYPGVTDKYNSEDIDMLLKWHESEEISLFELHRNQCVARIQGNRNPLIDYPEWGRSINFELSATSRYISFFLHGENDESTNKNLTACTPNPRPWTGKPYRAGKAVINFLKAVNALAPQRNKGYDGMIGDARHQKGDSDHNPQVLDTTDNTGIVTAIDITHDPKGGCDCNVIAASIEEKKDVRIKYIIWNERIMNSSPIAGAVAWTWRAYRKENKHTSHIHISFKCNPEFYDGDDEWTISVN